MLNVYILQDKYLKLVNIKNIDSFKNINPIWIDLINPTLEEKKIIENIYNFIFPKKKEKNIFILKKIFKIKKEYLYLYINFLFKDKKNIFLTTSVIFIIKNKILFSLREKELLIFNLIKKNYKLKYNIKNYKYILINLLEYNNEYIINILKLIYKNFKLINYKILKKNISNNDAIYILNLIIFIENLNNNIRYNLINIKKIINFLIKNKILNIKQQIIINEISIEIKIIYEHISYLFEKINFLMNISVSYVNIYQNKIFKFFSILSAVFLPSTMLASIYGMNFKFIPELNWYLGYPIVIFLMVFSIIGLLFYFYRNKWFE